MEFGLNLIEMLPLHSALHKSDNYMRLILINCIGAWFDKFSDDLDALRDASFMTEANGGFLDLIGFDYGVNRLSGESDDVYRERIIYESLNSLTVNYLINVYNVELYTYYEGFKASENVLLSDNPYLNHDGYYGIAEEGTRKILDKRFILNEGVEWLIL